MILTFNEAYEQYFRGIIGISKLRELIKQNKIPVVDIPSKRTFFDSEEIENWLKRKKETPIEIVPPIEYGKLRRIEE